MFRPLIFILLLAAFLGQGWAQASMAGMVAPAAPEDCAGAMASDTDGGCCPDGGDEAGACAAACSAAVVLMSSAPAVAIGLGSLRSTFCQPARAAPAIFR